MSYDFTSEYAKSARSSCKTCKDTIAKDTLRLGQMVQAPNFDGKIPMWHHVSCFFAKGNKGLTSFNMIHGRENIRLDDQQKLKKLIGEDSTGGEESKSEKPEKAEEAEMETEKAEETTTKKKGRGRKRKDAEEEEDKEAEKKETKKAKLTPEEEENQILWELRDGLKTNLSNKEMKEMLALNNQPDTGGASALISRCADGMLFGALPPCPECKQQALVVSGGHYKCTSKTQWGKCLYEADEVEYTPWEFPEWKDDYTFLKNFKFKLRKRLLKKDETVRAAVKEVEPGIAGGAKKLFHDVGTASDKPLEGMLIAFAGTLSMTQTKLKKIAEDLGAKVSSAVTVEVTHVLSSEEEYKSESNKIKEAIKFDTPVLSENFLFESQAEKKKLDQTKYWIGGSESCKKKLFWEFTDPALEQQAKDAEKGAEKKVKLIMKGRAAVDPAAGDQMVNDAHVLDDGGEYIYNVVLNLADVTSGINSFYGLQVLEHDKKTKYWVFRKWGRVGTKIGGTKLEEVYSKPAATKLFRELFLEKTGNEFGIGANFEKQPGKFFPIDIDYSGGDDGDDLKDMKKKMKDSKSSLPSRVQELISLIFDIQLMEESLIAMEIDLKKMPLGKLSKKHIQSGYGVLKDIEKVLEGEKTEKERKSALLELTNKFYTLIPHDFGTDAPKLIDSIDMLKDKLSMMETLIDIEIATSLLKDHTGSQGESVIDANYKKLKTEVEPIEKEGDLWKIIEQYIKNQRGSYKLDLLDAFEIKREGENGRYQTKKDLGNRHLLWHGSRLTNYVGILSQGLRIAPPEAPVSGYRFGKGVYFADICEKSAGYCRAGTSDCILMMLCEVALGNMKELLHDQYMEKALPGFHSTKAMGAIAPAKQTTLEDGIVVPFGPPQKTNVKSSCHHNEFIVYDVAQVQIRYLMKIRIT